MAIKFFEPEPLSTGFDPLPFLSEYVVNHDINLEEIFAIEKIIESPKGYLVMTNLFSEFYFKSSPTWRHLNEALAFWFTKTGKNAKKGLIGQVYWDKGHNAKPVLRLGIDTDLQSEWTVSTTKTGKKCFSLVGFPSSDTNTVHNSNPLLVSG